MTYDQKGLTPDQLLDIILLCFIAEWVLGFTMMTHNPCLDF